MGNRVKFLTGVSFVVVAFTIAYLYHEKEQIDAFYIAAEQGDAPRETSLGFFYYRGDPLPQSYERALYWWRRAANQGYGKAQFDVGYLYWFGKGVSKDIVQAYMWMLLACEQGDRQARDDILELTQSMMQSQIEDGKRLAREWKIRHFSALTSTPQEGKVMADSGAADACEIRDTRSR
jgi:TPR repeat protein